jgi:hypothetical protein
MSSPTMIYHLLLNLLPSEMWLWFSAPWDKEFETIM